MKKNALVAQDQAGMLPARQSPYQLVPTTLAEAMDLAKMIANSDLAPKDFKGKPENCFIAMQMGAEVGLSPMASIQNIAVINGRPSVWGDSMLAICQVHPDFEGIEEHFEADGTAVCTVKRKGYEPHTQTFSDKDAVAGGYATKSGPWQTAYRRMKQMRARAFALRDRFADALRGLVMAEEAMDMEPISVTVLSPEDRTKSQGANILSKLGKTPPADNSSKEEVKTGGDTNVQGDAPESESPSYTEAPGPEYAPPEEEEYLGEPKQIFDLMMDYFKDKKLVGDFIKLKLGKDRLKKWGDLDTLTTAEMTTLWQGIEKLKREES